MSPEHRRHTAALLAVLDAARERLALCCVGSHFGGKPCGKPAIYTHGSPNVAICKLHGRPHEGRHDLWPHPQTDLVAAIAAYDAIAEALPDLDLSDDEVARPTEAST